MVLILNYMFRRSYRGQSFNLVDSALLKKIILLKLLCRNDFDCKLALFLRVKSTINLTVCPFSNFLDKRIVINHFDHLY